MSQPLPCLQTRVWAQYPRGSYQSTSPASRSGWCSPPRVWKNKGWAYKFERKKIQAISLLREPDDFDTFENFKPHCEVYDKPVQKISLTEQLKSKAGEEKRITLQKYATAWLEFYYAVCYITVFFYHSFILSIVIIANLQVFWQWSTYSKPLFISTDFPYQDLIYKTTKTKKKKKKKRCRGVMMKTYGIFLCTSTSLVLCAYGQYLIL